MSRPEVAMQVLEAGIPGVRVVVPLRHGDARGWFSETYRADLLAAAGIADAFVQDNQSFSAGAGTIRGLHFQVAPAAQSKLVRVIQGAILDVAVDLRAGSPTYSRHVAVELSAANGHQLYVPVGFAHGFCTLAPDTMIAYKVAGGTYSPAHDRALAHDDPELAIAWPFAGDAATLSDKDRAAPRLSALGPQFTDEP